MTDSFRCRHTGSAFGETGALYTIGTKHQTQAWANPSQAGEVTVRWSSVSSGSQSYFVSHAAANASAYTYDSPGSWMAVDLGARRRLAVDHYALRNDNNGEYYALRNWELQGATSMEGPWTTLRAHADDTALRTAAHAEASWAVDNDRAFRCFRVEQTGAVDDHEGTAGEGPEERRHRFH